jgi:small subunit ribosomal protein S18
VVGAGRALLRRTALLTIFPPGAPGDPFCLDTPRDEGCMHIMRREPTAKAAVRKPKKKVCAFCKDKTEYIDYKDTSLLRKFISDRGKIRARRVTGNCSQHQRDVAVAVKNSREMALLPYTSTAR